MSIFEIVAFIAGIVGVWLATKENVLNWPLGILSVCIYAYVFYKSRLYGDMLLQVCYVVIGIYGWIVWVKKPNSNKISISSCERHPWLILVSVSIVFFFFLVSFLKKINSDVPYFDGLTTTLSLAATWMMARKHIEHWLIWIATDLLYVGLYIFKALYLTAVLYFVFTILAAYGFYEWKRLKNINQT